MARRSAKRIVLDEVAKRTKEVKILARTAFLKRSVNPKEYYKDGTTWYKNALVRLEEAVNIAHLLGATPDEIYQAECDGETMANATK